MTKDDARALACGRLQTLGLGVVCNPSAGNHAAACDRLAADFERVARPARTVDVVFDGPPDRDGPRFIEVETMDGKSVGVGDWVERPDGYWALRLDVVG